MGKEWTKQEIYELAIVFQARAEVGWNTLLSPETTLLVAEALHAYIPKPPPLPRSDPGSRFCIDAFSNGSAIYRMLSGEIFEVAAWAKNSLVAHAAFDRLLQQYPTDKFMQKRASWIERDMDDLLPPGSNGVG